MNATYNYKIIREMKLIVDCFTGDVSFDTYMEYKLRQVKDPHFDSGFNVLLDLRDAYLKFTQNEIDQGIKILLHTPEFVGKRRIAQLTKTPNQVVITTLVNNKNSGPIESATFSTLDGAVSFLEYKTSEKPFISSVLQEIKCS